MSEEFINRKSVWHYRWVAAISLLIVAGGIFWAVKEDNDVVAGITCFVLGIVLVNLGREEKDARLHIGSAISIGATVFLLWMFIKYMIVL